MQNLLDEKHITNAHLFIEKEEVSFVSLSLEQTFGQHHHFTAVLDYDALKKDFMNPLSQISLIGKRITIELMQGSDYSSPSYLFNGIITATANGCSEGKHGNLVIEGSSLTVLLERGKRIDVFSEMTLDRVVASVTEGIINKALDCVNQPVYQSTIPFLMQYCESDWEFLQRLSAISGETLYYTGLELVFGKQPREFPTMEVMYDREITSLRFNSRMLNNTFIRYQYLSDKDTFIEQRSPNLIENANEYVDAVAERSAKTIDSVRPVRMPVEFPVEDAGALTEIIKHRKGETAAQTLYVTGTAKTCHPRIGWLLKIAVPQSPTERTELGTYRVIQVKHTIDQNHRYRCEFEAVPAGLHYLPAQDIQLPVAGAMPAVVTKNNDPLGLGRVQVEFLAVNDMRSAVWMRVMTPDAGSSSEVGKNRGMVFVPEAGDQVMVGFEFGDPNRPYVMGSLFHGKNAAGGGTNNAIKSIITKSGIRIVFNDDEKSLHIEDPSGNTWDMDGKGNIAVNAPETITFNAKNMIINVAENMTTDVGRNQETSVGKDQKNSVGDTIEISSTKIEEQYTEDSKTTIGNKQIIQSGETEWQTTDGDMSIKSAGKALMQGAVDARVSKG